MAKDEDDIPAEKKEQLEALADHMLDYFKEYEGIAEQAYAMAIKAMEEGRWRDAVSMWKIIISQATGRHGDVVSALAFSEYRMGRIQTARAHLMEALAYDPPSPTAQFYAGLMAYEAGHMDIARDHYNKCIEYSGVLDERKQLVEHAKTGLAKIESLSSAVGSTPMNGGPVAFPMPSND